VSITADWTTRRPSPTYDQDVESAHYFYEGGCSLPVSFLSISVVICLGLRHIIFDLRRGKGKRLALLRDNVIVGLVNLLQRQRLQGRPRPLDAILILVATVPLHIVMNAAATGYRGRATNGMQYRVQEIVGKLTEWTATYPGIANAIECLVIRERCVDRFIRILGCVWIQQQFNTDMPKNGILQAKCPASQSIGSFGNEIAVVGHPQAEEALLQFHLLKSAGELNVTAFGRGKTDARHGKDGCHRLRDIIETENRRERPAQGMTGHGEGEGTQRRVSVK
jgi:hypothetical protein